ncbi:lysophospholipid acyltransferase family protein [Paraliomyxa miuraensis]|uniref:lysophospholipid acyltransferase family protein n=1 Tax=Paraliomyxa miuraensis TaxID=376150 RepID=UPI00224D277A|nr:lysophospholipid acyltransferase family protein [Paraliomyxa miuraensis]MCX4248049.1 acyltransferase family protein [Paraliomyxa miuraensis]
MPPLLRSKRLSMELLRPLLPDSEWDRVQAYPVADVGFGTDVFGTRRELLGFGYALGYWLHRHYFRVVSGGHEHIPKQGGGVVVGNHSGVLPFDGMMVAADVFRYTEPPRLVRYMVDYFVYQVPFVGAFFRGVGQMPGTRRNFDGLIEEGHLVGIFPEGAAALGKTAEQRYQLHPFTHGHVELAARHRVPVLPFGLVGAEEQQTMVADLQPLARALRLPYFPITTTFPWLGPLGLLPRPSRYFIHYGEPLHIDPDALRSIDVRRHEVERVQDAVAELLRHGQEVRREHQGAPR